MRWYSSSWMHNNPAAVSDASSSVIRSATDGVGVVGRLDHGMQARHALAVLIAGAHVDGWNFEAELRSARALAATRCKTLPQATERGQPGNYIDTAIESAKGDLEALHALAGELGGGFRRFSLHSMIHDITTADSK